MALFFYNNKRKDKHMKTKLIGYGIVLATFSNIMEAEPKDGEDVAQPSEAARFIAKVFRIIELQAETIRNMSIIIRNGERIAMEILERCGQNFVPTQGYDPELNEIENQNITFLKSHRNFPFVQYEPSTSEQDVETKSEVKNLSSSLDIWNQCLSSVGEKEKQSKEAIAQAQTEVAKLSEANLALKQENEGAMNQVTALQKENIEAKKANKQLIIEKQRVERRIEELSKSNKDIESMKARLRSTPVLQEFVKGKVYTVLPELK